MWLLEPLECENQQLQDELTSITEESDVGLTKSMLHAPSVGERQLSSGSGKLKSKRSQKASKATFNLDATVAQPKRTVTIGDLNMTIIGVSFFGQFEIFKHTFVPHVGNGQKHLPAIQLRQQNTHCMNIDWEGHCLEGRAQRGQPRQWAVCQQTRDKAGL